MAGGIGQSVLLNQLINRSLDTALRDLRFFGRDTAGRVSTATKNRKNASPQGNGNRHDELPLPPKIQSVLSQLFGQLAEALDSTEAIRETVELISQIPTCLKALAYALGRWIPRSQCNRVLYHHFHKVAVACLAPGVSSILHRNGAICRFTAQERSQLQGGSDFELGVAMLEAYLLLQFQSANEESQRVLKDMHDVLKELPSPLLDELNAAGAELAQLENGETESKPDFEKLRSHLGQTTGELAGLRDCREALSQLVKLAGAGVRARAELLPLAELASGAGDPSVVLDVIQSSGSRLRLVEIESEETACPECYSMFPVSVCSTLNNTTRIWRCRCGVLLARSLEK